MFKLTIQGQGLNFDIDITQGMVANVMRQVIASRFGDASPAVPPRTIMTPRVEEPVTQATDETNHEPSGDKVPDSDQEGEPP